MKTNVIFILADDMGYGDFGVFSEGNAITPAIDHMVSEGVCFSQHYAAAPVCTPSRASLLTGRYHHRTGAIDMRELRGLNNLSPNETTIADVFKENGYKTGLIGKWHNGTIGKKYHPNARGFDDFIGFRGGLSSYYDWRLYYNDIIKESDGRYLTDVFTDESINFINRHKDDPFFLKIAYNAPHNPLEAPEDDVKPFKGKGYTKAVELIYAMIYRMDKGIAKIFDELKRLGLDEKTIILFTSDNGPQFGGKGEMCSDRFNCNLRDSKGTVYEGGIRVPAVLRWPGKLNGGVINDCFVHGTDWFPTLLGLAGIEAPSRLKLDGVNIMPFLTGEAKEQNIKKFWQWNRYTPEITCNAAMRDGKWKLVRPVIREAMEVIKEDSEIDRIVEKNPEAYAENINPPLPIRILPPPVPPFLFDLENDPGEVEDVAGLYPEKVSMMLGELEGWFSEMNCK
jgi:arylsulfatase A